MERPQVMLGQRHESTAPPSCHELEENAIRLGEDVLDGVVVDLLDPPLFPSHLDDLRHPSELIPSLGVRPLGPTFPPEHDVIGGKRMTIGPAKLAQVKGEDAVLIGDFITTHQVGNRRIAVR